jgi:hypothetical protein
MKKYLWTMATASGELQNQGFCNSLSPTKGGIILVHDYFYGAQNGVYNAVNEFLEEMSLSAVPTADNTAIAIVKN